MKLRLLATASTHTANFKVMAAEYRFAAEGLEMLGSEIKTPLLNIGKNLTEEELAELVDAFGLHKDKKGLSFITAVMSECEKSTVLMEKAQKLVSELKNSEDNKKESSFGKNSGVGQQIKDFFRKFKTDSEGGAPKKVLNWMGSKLARIGILIMVIAAIYYGMSVFEHATPGPEPMQQLMEYGFPSPAEALDWTKSGAMVTILGIGLKCLGGIMYLFGELDELSNSKKV